MFGILFSSKYDCVAIDISGLAADNVYTVHHASGRARIVINKNYTRGIAHDMHPVTFDAENRFNWTADASWVAIGKSGRVLLRIDRVLNVFEHIPVIYLVAV